MIQHTNPEEETVNENDFIARQIEMLATDQRREVERARRAIAEARRELDEIESNLNLAADGDPYLRIGRISGVDAGAVFTAFATIETLARLRADAGRGPIQSSTV